MPIKRLIKCRTVLEVTDETTGRTLQRIDVKVSRVGAMPTEHLFVRTDHDRGQEEDRGCDEIVSEGVLSVC